MKTKSQKGITTKKVANTTLRQATKKVVLSKLWENVSEDKKFLVANGEILSNIWDLVHLLDHIDDYTFYHHVNDEKNDFYNWIKEMYGDGEFEKIILPIRNPRELEIAILKYIINMLSKDKQFSI